MLSRLQKCLTLTAAVVATAQGPAAPTLNAMAWQNFGNTTSSYVWPEQLLVPSIKTKPSVALCFSGGGSRSYLASFGYLRALLDLGLLKKAPYIAGISGGTWASVVFSFYQPNAPVGARNDRELLGDIVPPENLTWAGVGNFSERTARASVSKVRDIVDSVAHRIWNGSLPSDDWWVQAVYEAFLEPAGIPRSSFFSWSQSRVDEIKKRNPSLADERFVLPSYVNEADHPFLVVGSTMLGPDSLVPFAAEKRAYNVFESTPLYVGQALSSNLTYFSKDGSSEDHFVGGLVEPFGFGGPEAPLNSLNGNTSGILRVTPFQKNVSYYGLDNVTATSSFAPAEYFATVFPSLSNKLGDRVPYWPPADGGSAGGDGGVFTTLFGDGGDMENPHIAGMVRRRVRHIVAFCNFEMPLQPRSHFDPFKRAVTSSDMDDDIPAFFGIETIEPGARKGYFIAHNHIFNASEFNLVVDGLQASQANGTIAMATVEHTTVDNAFWGIEGGFKVNVTWVYLSRLLEWEARLSDDLRGRVQPVLFGKDDPASLRDIGTMARFPNYHDVDVQLGPEQANLLADLTGWSILENAEKWRDIFSE